MPVITLEVMSDCCTERVQPKIESETIITTDCTHDPSTGLHFLSEKPETSINYDERDESRESSSTRTDLLEYLMKNDGSVVCKLCGEVLQSRTHWYRHKYKHHVIQPLNPAPLFQCDQCFVYFKSRKGYIGHLASKHSEILSDATPILTNSQAEASVHEKATQVTNSFTEVKEQSDPEMSIPKSSVPNYQTTLVRQVEFKAPEIRRSTPKSLKSPVAVEQKGPEWEEQRSREEKLVADIIDRVRRECEAQGSGGPARRGYSRRYTVMNT